MNIQPKKIMFLDRDGIINHDLGYVYQKKDFVFTNDIFDLCHYLQSLNFEFIVVTNQSGISRGFYSEKDFLKLNKWMIDFFNTKGIHILDVFYCPHQDKDECMCRKPKNGLFTSAFKKFHIDKEKSWMIGDKISDIEAANSSGIINTVFCHKNEASSKAKFSINKLKELHNIIK
jgi:D-glycero-D-manno-heptose 1,7-bisphosphate phosphatase